VFYTTAVNKSGDFFILAHLFSRQYAIDFAF